MDRPAMNFPFWLMPVTWLLYNREAGISWRRQMYAQLQLITKLYKWYENDCIIFWLNGYILRQNENYVLKKDTNKEGSVIFL